MKYYIITGERSGDMHAGNLLKAINKKDSQAQARGVGGSYLKEAGADLAFNYADIAVMGFAEVVFSFRKVMNTFKKVRKDLFNYDPDVLILVDFGGFNIRMAKFAKARGIKVYYYITPKVWAWNQKRALKIKARVDRMFVILPFEKEFYKQYNWPVDYVGNPVMDAVDAFKPSNNFLADHNLTDENKLVALLPGSRKQELIKIIPLYKELVTRFENVQFIVAGVRSLPEELYTEINALSNVSVVYEQTYDLLNHADAAVVTSGTATLETALFDVPQVVVYKTHPISYMIARNLIRVNYISLVNLIADEEVVKELIQEQMNAKEVSNELNQLLFQEDKIQKVKNSYKKIRNVLGEQNASETTARLILNYLEYSRSDRQSGSDR
ncbi:MAG: lipid-A-disaccharide synthase [Candidatus Cyclobacteriaceae bacterium M2_1C_046]